MSKSEVEMIINMNSFRFSEIYKERYINNIYFDTPLLTNYFDNIEGNYNKKKTRIRWYGDLFGQVDNPILEFKIKKGELGEEKTYSLENFNFECDYFKNDFLALFDKCNQKSIIKTKGLRPTLLNRYKRKYFQSFDKKFRITLDTNLRYYSIFNRIVSLHGGYLDDQNVILELKYGIEMQEDANFISNNFPFRMTKSSKYVMGIERVVTNRQL